MKKQHKQSPNVEATSKLKVPLSKQFIVSIISIVLILFALNQSIFPWNYNWFNNKILAYWDDFNTNKANLDIEYRSEMRYGSNYINAKNIANWIQSKGMMNAKVLMPPTDYFKQRNIDFVAPQPKIFYYFTGLSTVWLWPGVKWDTAGINYFISVDNNNVTIHPFTSQYQKDSLIQAWSKLPYYI